MYITNHLPQYRSIEKGSNRRMPLCKEIDFPNEGLRKQPPPFGYSGGIVGSPLLSYHIWRILSTFLVKNLTTRAKYAIMQERGTTAPGDGTHHKKRANRYRVRHTAPVLQHEIGGDTHWKKTEIEKPRHPHRRRLCR